MKSTVKFSFLTLCLLGSELLSGNVLAENEKSQELNQNKTSTSEWFSAADSGDLQTMKSLFENKHLQINLCQKNDTEKTVLEIAITHGYYDMVKWIVDRTNELEQKHGATFFNLKSSNKDNKPMMIVAIENGHETIVKFMLSKAIDPNVIFDLSSPSLSKTPLIVATEKGYIDIVDLLLTSKGDPLLLKLNHSRADPNQKDGLKRTALMYAAKKGYTDIAELLLKNKADPNKKDSFNCTALMTATVNGHESFVKLLLEYGADPNIKNSKKETALILAVKKGYLDISKQLLDYGAKIKSKDKEGKNALDYAKGNEDMTKLLMDYIDRPENQKKTSLIKHAWNKITNKKDNSNKTLSEDSLSTLNDSQIESVVDETVSFTDTLVDEKVDNEGFGK